MESVYVLLSNIRPGVVISEDVFANTANPIIEKDTKVTAKHIEVLQAFGIRRIKVEDTIVKREDVSNKEGVVKVNPDQILADFSIKKVDFEEEYRKAVQSYKREYFGWRSGTRPDIAKIRSITIPFLETFNNQKNLLNILGDLPDSKDYKYHHAISVGIIAAAISKRMGYPAGQSLQLGLAGVLADCGMSKIDEVIIEKSAFLTKEEFNEVKKHVVISFQLIQDTPFLRPEMKEAILQHHERLDGSGYPRGIKQEQISVYSQILAVSDVFHAMISERIYRAKESPFKVIEMIKEEEFGKFNLKVIQALHDLVCNLSIGTNVKLTDGREGTVIFVHRDAVLRPTIKLDTDDSILDLTTNRHLSIQTIL